MGTFVLEVVMPDHEGLRRSIFILMAAPLFPALLHAQAAVDVNLVGQWEAQIAGSPVKMNLRIEPSGRCSLDDEPGMCQAKGAVLVYRSPDGEQSRYSYRLQEGQLVVSGGDLVGTMVFRRLGATGTRESSAVPDARTPSAPAAVPTQARTSGYTHEGWGVGLGVPPNWKVVDRGSALAMGSDSEPGLIIIRLVKGTDRAALLADYREGISDEGLHLRAESSAQEFTAGQHRGLAGELAGIAADHSQIKARIVAVLSPFGDAAVFLGITTADKYSEMKRRVDTVAAGVSFARPRAPQANLALAGQYYYFTSSSVASYSREDTLNLCSNGMFSRGGEMYASQAGQWGAASQGGASGRWSAEGSDSQGIVILNYSNGKTARIQYQRSGSDMIFDGRKHAQFGDGSCSRRSPF